ncbi:MAG TPA: hypothetical protein VIW45_13355 [Vicinamibacterales bacterium]
MIDVGIVFDDGSGGRLDNVSEVSRGESTTNGVNGRRREDDIADFSKPNQEDP